MHRLVRKVVRRRDSVKGMKEALSDVEVYRLSFKFTVITLAIAVCRMSVIRVKRLIAAD